MRLGVDDTDSPQGGCTTHVLTGLVALARGHGLDVLGEPKLVRLNPNVPWKTRGNAALSVTLGHGGGPAREIGEVDGAPVLSYRRGRPESPEERRRYSKDAWRFVRENARPELGTDPALVVVDRTLPESLYTAAVSRVVDPLDVEDRLRRENAWYRLSGSRRGIVGAAAAAAWPGRRRTWEVISYRNPGARGSREVDAASVLTAARRERSLFLCHDPRTRRLLVVPHTPCPILFGLRSKTAEGALRARPWVRSEPVDRWLLFRTNQGTGDHLRAEPAVPLGPFTPARLNGHVVGSPTIYRGGHVRFQISVHGVRVDCHAFEPTKVLPSVARGLCEGDEVEVWGGTRDDPTLRAEGIVVRRLARRVERGRPPRCPACSRRARSLGAGRGFRCPGCHRRWPPEASRARKVTPVLHRGVYHPTPSARRHLAPLGPEPAVTAPSA